MNEERDHVRVAVPLPIFEAVEKFHPPGRRVVRGCFHGSEWFGVKLKFQAGDGNVRGLAGGFYNPFSEGVGVGMLLAQMKQHNASYAADIVRLQRFYRCVDAHVPTAHVVVSALGYVAVPIAAVERVAVAVRLNYVVRKPCETVGQIACVGCKKGRTPFPGGRCRSR